MKKVLALIMAMALVVCFAACGGGGECENCGAKTSNKLTIEGETGYVCDDCCESTFGMSFDEVKAMMEAAGALE